MEHYTAQKFKAQLVIRKLTLHRPNVWLKLTPYLSVSSTEEGRVTSGGLDGRTSGRNKKIRW